MRGAEWMSSWTMAPWEHAGTAGQAWFWGQKRSLTTIMGETPSVDWLVLG
jgi:hypothetical protein